MRARHSLKASQGHTMKLTQASGIYLTSCINFSALTDKKRQRYKTLYIYGAGRRRILCVSTPPWKKTGGVLCCLRQVELYTHEKQNCWLQHPHTLVVSTSGVCAHIIASTRRIVSAIAFLFSNGKPQQVQRVTQINCTQSSRLFFEWESFTPHGAWKNINALLFHL